jgi:cell division protein FtsZ
MKFAEAGIAELQKGVDTQIIIPNQNLFRVANEKTTFADAFAMADQVLYSGVACITDLMVKEGLINLDFADVRAIMREMGKAMMGTGEASGEKRALRAAEAAISNPLIDDVSMKGARGLLISITGGKDLTLYEVDEAATRIREEVDQEANIIVGATFDEGLEGIIRVSVVATGIDHIVTAVRNNPDSRGPELVYKGRMDHPRHAERMEPAPRATPTAPAQPLRPSVEQAATAAVAAAVMQHAAEDVTIRPLAPKPSLFMEPQLVEPAPHEMPKAFIPPQPERPTNRAAPRMPRLEELPIPAQNEIRAQRGEVSEENPEKRRMSLLQRLAAVGLGRRDGEDATPAEPARTPNPQLVDRLPPRGPSRPPEPVSEYARRGSSPAPQGLDPHGRPAPVHKAVDDDQLDIPAFLRRQAN